MGRAPRPDDLIIPSREGRNRNVNHALKEQREELTEQGEILFRQVHPQFFTGSRISSQAFEAPRSHEGMLSVDLESLTTAKDSFTLFTKGFGLSSTCVCGVSVSEVNQHQLHAYPEPIPAADDHPANEAHAVIDMAALGKKQMKKLAGHPTSVVSPALERRMPSLWEPRTGSARAAPWPTLPTSRRRSPR